MCSLQSKAQDNSNELGLIPMPQKIEMGDGMFEIDQTTVIYIDSSLINEASHLIKAIESIFGRKIEVSVNTGRYTNNKKWIRNLNTIILSLVEDPNEKKDAYDLIISSKYVLVKASTKKGVFYGIQTLLQLLPSKEQYYDDFDSKLIIPQLQIRDYSEFALRSFKLDCSAFYLDVPSIKKYIDLMAYYKMNCLHWKLTGNEGWRLDVEAYPRLTKVGAWSLNAEGEVVGGYYSRENVNEVIKYAKSRFIDVVPEIELPGNTLSILNVYPEFACTDGPFELSDFINGNKEVLCAGKREVYQFVFSLLNQVKEMFPSKMIHIGGVDLNYYRWRSSTECQQKIRSKHLINEKGLEAYFVQSVLAHLRKINRVGAINHMAVNLPLNSKNILYWTGGAPLKKEFSKNQYIVYNDRHYTNLEEEIKVVSMDSIYQNYLPLKFFNSHHSKLLGGVAQFKVNELNHLKMEKLILPRILPIASLLWNYEPKRNTIEFSNRFKLHKHKIEDKGYRTGSEKYPFKLKFYPSSNNDSLLMQAKFQLMEMEMIYNYENNKGSFGPFVYNGSIEFDKDVMIELSAKSRSQFVGDKHKYKLNFHKGLGKEYKCLNDTNLLLNHLNDGVTSYNGVHDWLTVYMNNLDVQIDLGRKQRIKKIQIDCFQAIKENIFLPEWVKVEVSTDGENYEIVKILDHPISLNRKEHLYFPIKGTFKRTKARYLRLSIKNIHHCPKNHPSTSKKALITIGEIIVE